MILDVIYVWVILDSLIDVMELSFVHCDLKCSCICLGLDSPIVVMESSFVHCVLDVPIYVWLSQTLGLMLWNFFIVIWNVAMCGRDVNYYFDFAAISLVCRTPIIRKWAWLRISLKKKRLEKVIFRQNNRFLEVIKYFPYKLKENVQVLLLYV